MSSAIFPTQIRQALLCQAAQKDGRCESADHIFLDPVRDCRNLTLGTGAPVYRVLFDGHQATGGELANWTLSLCQGGKVIRSGGAINPPQILLLSGIGPCVHRQSMGIPVLDELPEIGTNHADHLNITVQAGLRGRMAIGNSSAFPPCALRDT